jgi:hypothetical protein
MDNLATFFVSLMYGSENIPDFLIDRTGTQYKLIDKKDIIDILRAKNKSRRKLHRKYTSSSSDIPSTPAGGGGSTNTATPSTTVTAVDERNRQRADEEQYDDEDSEDDDEDSEDDNDIDDDDGIHKLNNASSEQQQEGFITLQVQSDLNDNSINLAEVPDDTPLGQLLVNFKRFTIFLFI